MRAGASNSRRRAWRWVRRTVGLVALVLPTAWFVLGDLVRRKRHILTLHSPFKWYYRATIATSLAIWAVLLLGAARRRSKVSWGMAAIFVALFTLASGTQGGFYAIFHWYLNLDAELYSRSLVWTLVGSLPFSKPAVWFHFASSLVAGMLFVRIARKYTRPSKWAFYAALVLMPAVAYGFTRVPVSYAEKEASSPDVLYFHAMVGSYEEQLGVTKVTFVQRPQKRHSLPVPPLVAKPARKRNVVLLLEESQRADLTCIDHRDHCPLSTAFSNRAAPDRLPFLQWRALDSSTTLSFSTIFTGLLPSDPLHDLETAPTLWGYAKAAGYDTGYFSAQHLVFQNLRMQMQDEPIDHFAGATTIDLDANWSTGPGDMKLTDWVIDHFSELREPFFIVVHYSQLHSPYVFDPRYAPFPFDRSKSDSALENRMAYQRNLVYLADMAVAKLVDFVKGSEFGNRTVIAFTSDHGESAGDHGYGGHTYTLFDSEVHVPTWIDAPAETLSPDERENLETKRDAYMTHADLGPTLLDLLGVWDDAALGPFRAHMRGHPITRATLTTEPLPITTCSWIWECEKANWGYLQQARKIHVRQGMTKYDCYDLRADPGETKNLGEARCSDLVELAHGLFSSAKDAPKPLRPLH